MADWYYAKNGQQFGPISPTELKKLAKEGVLSPDDLVFQIGGTKWVEASSVKGLFPPTGSKPTTPVHATPTPEPVSVPAPTPTPAPADDFDLSPGPGKVTDRQPSTGIRARQQDDDFDIASNHVRPASTNRSSSSFMDFMMLRSFISPIVLVVLFWLTVVAALGVVLLGSLMGLLMMAQEPVLGLEIIFGSILLSILLVFVYRIFFEIAIVIFRIAEEATRIRKILEKLSQEK